MTFVLGLKRHSRHKLLSPRYQIREPQRAEVVEGPRGGWRGPSKTSATHVSGDDGTDADG